MVWNSPCKDNYGSPMKKRGHRITEHLLLGLFHGFLKAFQKNKVLSRDFKQSKQWDGFLYIYEEKNAQVGESKKALQSQSISIWC